MRSGLRSFLGLVAATLVLPLVVVLLGYWEQQRGEADWAEVRTQQVRLIGVVERLEQRLSLERGLGNAAQFRRGGQTYIGPLAVAQARAALDEVSTVVSVMDARRILPPVVMWAAGIAIAVSVFVLLAGAVLDRLGRLSREVLVRGFTLVRFALPALLAAQVALGTVAFVAAVAFEAAALARPGLGGAEVKLLLLAAAAVLGSLFAAGTAAVGLRRALSAFEPDPLPILGRTVTPAEAPGLWRLVSGLADRLGAVKPDTIVVGLTDGFFVSAGAKVLTPSDERLSGPTLYVPLPFLPLMRADEVASVIGHELAHFAGSDAAYSLRFLPIYAGVGRSLDAVAAGGGAGLGLPSSATRLGVFVMDRFHHGVQRWSRAREFAADAAGAGLTSPEAAARALLRHGAIPARVVEVLDEAVDRRNAAPADLVAAIVDRADSRGFDDPAAHLEAEQPHPTDAHPPTRLRVARLGVGLTPDLLATVVAPPPPGALGRLADYFADPAGVCRTATNDFLAVVARHDEDVRSHMQATADAVGSTEHALQENTRPGGLFFTAAGVVFAAAGVPVAFLGLPSLSLGEARIAAAVLLVVGLAFAAFGLVTLRRKDRPYLVLRPEGVMVTGLDRAIPWSDVADLDMTLQNSRMATRLLLPPDAPFPKRVPGWGRAKLDRKRRIVTVTAGLPRGIKAQDFADLVTRYRAAAEARRFLAEAEAPPTAQPAAAANPFEVP